MNPLLSRRTGLIAALALAASAPVLAQNTPEPSNQISLSASAFKDVPEDWLSMVLSTNAESADPITVQNQLKVTLEKALAAVRPQVQDKQLEVRTGSFGIHPRHNNQGRVIGWQGSAEIVIEGRDFAKVSSVAGKVPGMTVGSADFSLSREARQKLESEVQAMAVERFRQKAQELSRSFGFTGYTVRQVSVSSVDRDAPQLAFRSAAPMPMAAAADMAVPVEAGKATVNITVSGSVALR
jgi:predicted secreted protein